MYQSSQTNFCMYCGNYASSTLESIIRPSLDSQRISCYETFTSQVQPKVYNQSLSNTKSNYSGHSFSALSYQKKAQYTDFFKTGINEEYSFFPDDFLRSDRRRQKFIGQAEEIKEYVEEIFQEVTGWEFPEDVRIILCSRREFKGFSSGVVGLSVNRKEEGLISDVFVLNDELDRVLLTVGHELGHVLTRPLKDRRDEEAKAFAFSFAWMEAIKEKNIAGLAGSLAFDQPANNGLHDLAFNFVLKSIREGKKSLEIYWGLVAGLLGWSV